MRNVGYMGHIGKACEILLGKPKEKDHFEDIRVDVQVLK
jgi:hypothetical protein